MAWWLFIKVNSTSSIKSLLTHVGNLCRIASRARAVEDTDVSPDDELSSSSTREVGNILYHGHVDLVLLDSLCPKNCIPYWEDFRRSQINHNENIQHSCRFCCPRVTSLVGHFVSFYAHATTSTAKFQKALKGVI